MKTKMETAAMTDAGLALVEAHRRVQEIEDELAAAKAVKWAAADRWLDAGREAVVAAIMGAEPVSERPGGWHVTLVLHRCACGAVNAAAPDVVRFLALPETRGLGRYGVGDTSGRGAFWRGPDRAAFKAAARARCEAALGRLAEAVLVGNDRIYYEEYHIYLP